MIDIELEGELKRKVLLSAERCMGSESERFVAELYYFDGYSELTKKQYNKDGSIIDENDIKYVYAKRETSSDFFFSLDPVKNTRKGLKKGDKAYWNHCLVIIDRSGKNNIVFDYSEKLEEAREKGLLDSLGEELYEKYTQEREKGTNVPVSNDVKPSDDGDKNIDMSINQLLGAIYQELVNDISLTWMKLQIESEVFQHNGQEVVSNYFHYQDKVDEELKEFTPKNIFIPGNAMKQIQKKMQEENDGWRKALFTFNKDKSCDIDVLEK